MKISKKEIEELVAKEVIRQRSKIKLENKAKEIKDKLQKLNENNMLAQAPEAQVSSNEEKESFFDAKPGEMVVLGFEGVTIKVQRQLDDLFKIVDATESAKLKEGDYIKVQGDDILSSGKSYTFSVIRQIDPKYKTNSLIDWRIIKN